MSEMRIQQNEIVRMIAEGLGATGQIPASWETVDVGLILRQSDDGSSVFEAVIRPTKIIDNPKMIATTRAPTERKAAPPKPVPASVPINPWWRFW